jgi:hypothetical protein
LGNPSYQIDLLSDGVLAVGFEWLTGFQGAQLTISNLAGDVIAMTENNYTTAPRIGADLSAGTYVVNVRSDCCNSSDQFNLTFLGNLSPIFELDTDSDGLVDSVDSDDDNDGIDDSDELLYPLFMDPLDRFDADQDQDGDGWSNRDEIDPDSTP